MKFKEWLKFVEDINAQGGFLPLGDPARRPDLIKAGTGGCQDLPLGMRSACQPTTSAFPTYELPIKKSKRMKKR